MTARRQRMRLWLSPSSFVGTPKLQPTTWITPYSTSEGVSGGERVETGHGFSWLAIDDNAIWATNAIGKTVTRIDARALTVTNRSELRRTPAAIARGADSVWIVCTNGWLWRFSPEGLGEGVARLRDHVRGLACDPESTWVLHAGGHLVGVDQTTGEPGIETKVGRGGRQLLHADGALFALCGNGRKVRRVSTATGEVEAEAKLPARGVRGTILDGTLWVACGRRFSPGAGTLIPVDLGSLAVGTPLQLPSAPRAITAGAGALWVACGSRGKKSCTIERIDPGSGKVTRWAESEWNIYDLAVDEERLLAAMGLALVGPAAAGMGGEGAVGGAPAHHGGYHGGGGGGHGGGH